MFWSFPALVLRRGLPNWLAPKGPQLEWAGVNRDRDKLLESRVVVCGKCTFIRSEIRGGEVAQAAGEALPPGGRSC